jgi:hypothetical protein
MYSRFFTALTFATFCTASLAHAQNDKLFQNSWFWGVHAGATYAGTTYSSGSSGTLGAEWMITRSVGGLYLSFDQANLNSKGAVDDPSEPSGYRAVSIHDLRTGSIAALAFPVQWGNFRPYGGLGFAISVIGNATPQADVVTQVGAAPAPVDQGIIQKTEDARSRSSVFFMGGGQWQLRQMAVFGQVSVTPSTSDFLINGTITQVSVGVRYNFGSSIER